MQGNIDSTVSTGIRSQDPGSNDAPFLEQWRQLRHARKVDLVGHCTSHLLKRVHDDCSHAVCHSNVRVTSPCRFCMRSVDCTRMYRTIIRSDNQVCRFSQSRRRQMLSMYAYVMQLMLLFRKVTSERSQIQYTVQR